MSSVSVVIPTHNRSTLTIRALTSVYAQTHLPNEIIVIDDGSSDDSAEAIRRKFPSVCLITQQHSGVSQARNRGIERSRSRYVAFLDSDDEWLPTKIEEQLKALERAPGYRLCHSDEIWVRNHARVNPMRKHAKKGGYIFRECLPLCTISPSAVILERALLTEVGLFNPDLPACEDYDLWLRICARHKVLLVDKKLVTKYGGHPDQLSRRYYGMDRFRVRALEDLLSDAETWAFLSQENRQAALMTLLAKIDILFNGANKRGKQDEAEYYREKKRRWIRVSTLEP